MTGNLDLYGALEEKLARFKGADAARKGDKRVGAIKHDPLSFMHVVGDDQLVDLFEHDRATVSVESMWDV